MKIIKPEINSYNQIISRKPTIMDMKIKNELQLLVPTKSIMNSFAVKNFIETTKIITLKSRTTATSTILIEREEQEQVQEQEKEQEKGLGHEHGHEQAKEREQEQVQEQVQEQELEQDFNATTNLIDIEILRQTSTNITDFILNSEKPKHISKSSIVSAKYDKYMIVVLIILMISVITIFIILIVFLKFFKK